MQTLKIELSDELYEDLKSTNLDIQSKIRNYLINLVDDGYPSISTDEAKKRVSDAVDRYRNGTGSYTSYDNNFVVEMENYIQSL